MNIRVHLKSGDSLDFPLREVKTMEELYDAADFNKSVIMFCGTIIMMNDISYIKPMPSTKEELK